MKFYNTLTRSVEKFKPIKDNEVRLYTCGPTVYDYMHVGNLRKFVFDDSLRRILEIKYSVRHAMNITDVGHLVSDADEGEDKLEKGAKREDKSVWDTAQHYIDSFEKDVSQMNIKLPNAGKKNGGYLRATDFIQEQIQIVQILLDKNFAYLSEQAIYFDTSKLESYGELTGQKLTDKEVGARPDVVTDSSKRHPQDFAVWFFAVGRFANHEMKWVSPWGQGFPGWHLECSAIIHTVLGDPIDIHTGGVDNIGTHHVNEMAQTEAAFGHKLANYWLHSEHLHVDGGRMAKSAGNFYTLSDVIKKGYEPLALRLLFLQSHYRSQMNFTWEALDGAQAFLKRLQAWSDLRFQSRLGHKKSAGSHYGQALSQMEQSLADDLNTSQSLAVLSKLVAQAETDGIDTQMIQPVLDRLDELLGLDLSNRENISIEQRELIEQREKARASKDWVKSDQLRAQLASGGIEINDTPHGSVWSRL